MKNRLMANTFSKTLIASAVVFALAGCSATQNETQAVANPKVTTEIADINFVRSVEGIEEYQLSNGLKVLLYPDQAQSKVIVNVTYRVGSVHEHYGETGMAHLLEHMLFKGSTNYKDIDKEFNKRGMGANASAWLDRTNYYQSFESSPENLEWAIGMEADRMVNATFTKEQLESEMTVVRNEMERGENSPIRILMARMNSSAYLWHNYGNSTIGARSDVENFPFERLRRFYDKHYRPDNAVLTIAGRFDKQFVLDQVQKQFGRLAKPETPVAPLYTKEPTQDGDREVNLRRVGEVPVIALHYHIPSALHSDTAALQVFERIFSDTARGRMQKTLVEPGKAPFAGTWSMPRNQPSGMYFMANGFKGQDYTDLEQSLVEMVESVKENKITEEELNQAKTAMLKEKEDALRNVVSVGSQLTEYIAMGDYRYIFYLRDLIEKVTLEDVQRVAEKYFVKSNRTLGRFIPTEAPVRAEITEDASIKEQLATYKGRAVVEAGEVYDNTVANIEARKKEFKWDLGTTVSVYPKKLRGGEVNITMKLPTGNVNSLKGYVADFNLMGGLMFSGSEKYSKEQIATKLAELKASIRFNTNSVGNISVNVKAVKENLNETLDFVAELMTNPLFEESEIAIDRKATITGLETQRSEPRDVAANAFRKAFYGYAEGHPKAYRDIDTKIADLNRVTQKRLKELHKSHWSFSNGHIGVVGDVDAKAISAALESKFSHLAGKVAYEEMEPKLNKVTGADNWIETPDKANAQLYIVNRLDLNQQHPDYYAASIANSIFGGSGFASRLMQRIRVKEGYSYGTGSWMQLEFDKPSGMYFMYAIAAPENMKPVVAAYKEEVEKVLKDGFTDEEVKNAIDGDLKALWSSWANDARIGSVMVENQDLGRELSWFNTYEEKLRALTTEEVNAAFRKYIGEQELNIFAAGDFAKAGKK